MQFSTFLTSLTQDEIAPRIIDGILNSNVLAARILGNPERWSGESLKVPFKYKKNTQGGSYDGFDTFSTQQENTRVSMVFYPKGEDQPVVISGMQKAVNAGSKTQVINLVKAEMESCKQDMIDNIGTRFYGDGTGNGGKDFTGLAAAVDDGSVAATYGGLSRSTYTGLQSPVTTGVGNLTLSAMGSLFDEISVTGEDPTLIVTTNAVWSLYEQLLTPTVRASYETGYPVVSKDGGLTQRGGLAGQAGFVALNYRGVPVVKDNKCTSGYMYFLNENYLKFHAVDRSDLEMRDDKGTIDGVYSDQNTAFKPIYWRPMIRPVNQDAEIGVFIMNGELVNMNPRKSGVLQGITGV